MYLIISICLILMASAKQPKRTKPRGLHTTTVKTSDYDTYGGATGISDHNMHKFSFEEQNRLMFGDENYIVYCKFQPNGYDCNTNKSDKYEFYYDIKMQACKTFKYGRCQTFNAFPTLKDCYSHCKNFGPARAYQHLEPEDYCHMQPDFGSCNQYHIRYYFDVTLRDCKAFSYSGCGGNKNIFRTKSDCMLRCHSRVSYTEEMYLDIFSD